MKNAVLGARIVLGLIFFVFGLNGFLDFLPIPELPNVAGAFLGALASSGYLMVLVKATEIVVGVALLSGRFVPLALVVLVPITVNIFLFHAVLAPAGLLVPVVVAVLHGFLIWAYRSYFAGLKAVHAVPGAA